MHNNLGDFRTLSSQRILKNKLFIMLPKVSQKITQLSMRKKNWPRIDGFQLAQTINPQRNAALDIYDFLLSLVFLLICLIN